MKAVPGPPERAEEDEDDEDEDVVVSCSPEPQPVQISNGTASLEPMKALPPGGPQLAPDPGLYAVLGLDPSVSDAEIQTTYRRQAARVHGGGSNNVDALRQLNVAYEVLGNHVRRVDYDRQRMSQAFSPGPPTPIRAGAKAATRVTRRRRPRSIVQPRYAGFPDVLVVLMVVGVAVLAGALIIPRLSVNLSALNALQNVLPLSNSARRTAEATAVPGQTSTTPTATVAPGVSARFAGSAVSVSNANPAQNSTESVVLRLRRDGQPAADFDVWAIVKYSTTQERWPASGSQKTDATGVATITFNIGRAIADRPVAVEAFAQVDDQQLSWSTTFTPH